MDLDHLIPLKLDASYLFVSLFWSAVGTGFWVYARKQRSIPALAGGTALFAISWLISSAFWMSLAALGIIAGIYYWSRHD